jgi:DNA polymerase-3 subunit delta
MVDSKKNQEYSNCLSFLEAKLSSPPQVLTFIAQDSFEFDILLDYYKEFLSKLQESFEVIVFTGEGGEMDLFFSHCFTPDMFYPTKLIVIKSGSAFFKPFISAQTKKPNDLYQNFTHHLPQLSEKVYILIHYDSWEIPASIKKIFGTLSSFVISKNFYPNETRKNLEVLMKKMEINLSTDAIDEFLHRIPPNMGSYMKSLTKLKSLLGKKKFEIEDIENILMGRSSLNYSNLVSYFFQNRKAEFFKEMRKFSDLRAELGILLSKLLDRLNELRIYRTIHRKNKSDLDESLLYEMLGVSHFSEGRKFHILKELKLESKYFKDKTMEDMYEILVNLNFRHKTNADTELLKIVIEQKFLKLFRLLEN